MSNPKNADWSTVTGPLVELQEINKKASEEMIRECISFCSDSAGTTSKYMQTMPRITNPEDFAATQVKLFAQQAEKVLEYTQNIFSIYQETVRDQLRWATENFNTALKSNPMTMKDKKAGESA